MYQLNMSSRGDLADMQVSIVIIFTPFTHILRENRSQVVRSGLIHTPITRMYTVVNSGYISVPPEVLGGRAQTGVFPLFFL